MRRCWGWLGGGPPARDGGGRRKLAAQATPAASDLCSAGALVMLLRSSSSSSLIPTLVQSWCILVVCVHIAVTLFVVVQWWAGRGWIQVLSLPAAVAGSHRCCRLSLLLLPLNGAQRGIHIIQRNDCSSKVPNIVYSSCSGIC
jgi:hypothetical protein